MKIAIYDKYLATMGGGEKYMGVIAEYLSSNNEVEILTCIDVDKQILSKRLNLDLSKVNISNIGDISDEEISIISKNYEMFINSTYMSRVFNQSSLGVLVVFFPNILDYDLDLVRARIGNIVFRRLFEETSPMRKFLKKTISLFAPLARSLNINKFLWQKKENIKFRYEKYKHIVEHSLYLKTYKYKFTISEYSRKWMSKMLGINTKILYPPVDIEEFNPGEKKNIILSAGRFFVETHNKKQLEMIKFFKAMYDKFPEAHDYEYHLCGGVDDRQKNQEYLALCKKEAQGYPVFIHDNASFEDLKKYYSEAKIFWHGAGFGEDPLKHPDLFEHFGITTVEAMSAGTVPVVIGLGGQPEIVTEAVNGFLWLTPEDLMRKTIELIRRPELLSEISKKATQSCSKFSRQEMYNRIHKLLGL